jgi:metallo-beta-lactamase family protein
MATAGRIKHHLRNHISDPRNTVLFVGYQASGSLGRVIQEGTDPVRIFGDWFPVKARVATIDGFSAHADQTQLLEWYARLDGVPRCTYVVHGEEPAARALAALLEDRFGATVEVPKRDQSFTVS